MLSNSCYAVLAKRGLKIPRNSPLILLQDASSTLSLEVHALKMRLSELPLKLFPASLSFLK